MDPAFAQAREGVLLRDVCAAFEANDEDLFTQKVREYDDISKLDPQKTSLLLAVKVHIKNSAEDISTSEQLADSDPSTDGAGAGTWAENVREML